MPGDDENWVCFFSDSEVGALLTSIRHFSAIGMLACSILVAACQKGPPPRATDGEPETASGGVALAGNWRWVTSERAGQIVRPAGPADSLVLSIGLFGGYEEHANGSTLESRYWLAQGRLYQLRDSMFVVLVLDTSSFFPRYEQRPRAVAVRSMTADSLVLSGTGTDATFHTFARVASQP